MNCQDFELVVLRLARNQLIEAADLDRIRAHAEACVRCAARLAEERALILGVRIVAAEIAQEEAPVRLETKLLRALREHTAIAARATGSPPALHEPLPRRALAAAAVILISLTAAAILRHMSSPPEQMEVGQTIKHAPSLPTGKPPEPTTPQLKPVRDDGRKRAAAEVTASRERPKRRRPGLRDSSDAEVATSFFLLSDSDDFNSLESGQVVRLELPGSALEEMGVPIDVVMAGKTVTADVVIGPDGLAHAIRFIPPSNQ